MVIWIRLLFLMAHAKHQHLVKKQTIFIVYTFKLLFSLRQDFVLNVMTS